MTTIEIDVDEKILREAEEALHSIGMDVQIAVNVFLRRVAIEKGLPMSMTVSAASQREDVIFPEDEVNVKMNPTRTNNTITKEMVEEVWQAFLKYLKGLREITRLRYEVEEDSGMNNGSAFIYLNILANLVKGEPNTRTLKMKDLEYFMVKIKTELEPDKYQNAKQSLKDSIPYWAEKLVGSFADHVQTNLNTIWK